MQRGGLLQRLSGKESACKAGDTEMRIQSLGQEKEMAPHSSNLAQKIPWTEEQVG